MCAADRTACLPQDLSAWRRLAQEVLVQAAKDANGRGFMSCREDVKAARKFFYSGATVYVQERSVWFGMAGLAEPKQADMETMVEALVSYGCNNRRSSAARE